MPNLTEAVRERCSLESITQPTWHSMGGLELCRVFLFLGVCKVAHNSASGSLNPQKQVKYIKYFPHIAVVLPWHLQVYFPLPPGKNAASWSGPFGEACEVCEASGHCGSWGSQAQSWEVNELLKKARGHQRACLPKHPLGLKTYIVQSHNKNTVLRYHK